MNDYSVTVMSPSDKISSVVIKCEERWLIKDLKSKLHEVYPTHPIPSTQRLICHGRLLKDDENILDIFTDGVMMQTIHLVCPIVKRESVKCDVPDVPIANLPHDELQQYQREYYNYLQNFYLNNQASSSTLLSSQQSQSMFYYGYPGYYPYQSPFAAPYNPVYGEIPADGNRQEDAAPARPAAPAQQAVAAPAMLAGLGGAGNDDIGAEGGEMDFVDRFYALFRFCLFLGLCMAYSSLDKALIVFAMAAYVYFYNIYRQRAPVNQVMGDVQAQPQQPDANAHQSSDSVPADASNQLAPVNDGTSSTTPENEQRPAEPRISRFTGVVRSVAVMSFQFVCGFFASLIPEQPPPIRFD